MQREMGKTKGRSLKPIIEEICFLIQKKVHFENLIKDVRKYSDKLGYDVVKTNKFKAMKATLEKSLVLNLAAG